MIKNEKDDISKLKLGKTDMFTTLSANGFIFDYRHQLS